MVKPNGDAERLEWQQSPEAQIPRGSTRQYPVIIILVENGDVFEGTFAHWQDCFFAFSSEDIGQRLLQIINFCCDHEWSVTFKYEIQTV